MGNGGWVEVGEATRRGSDCAINRAEISQAHKDKGGRKRELKVKYEKRRGRNENVLGKEGSHGGTGRRTL